MLGVEINTIKKNTEALLEASGNAASGPYPEPDAQNSQFPPYFPKIHSNITLESTRVPQVLFPSGFPT
jgi:hypothetical protein